MHDLVKMLGDGAAVIRRDGGGICVWSRRKLRKPAKCAVCGERIAVGALAYGPVGNQSYRWARIGAEHIDSVSD